MVRTKFPTVQWPAVIPHLRVPYLGRGPEIHTLLRPLLFIPDYLLLRAVGRHLHAPDAGYPLCWQAIPAGDFPEIDLLVVHYEPPRFTRPFQLLNSIYLSEIVYPDVPVLILSDEPRERVLEAFRFRPATDVVPTTLPGDRLREAAAAVTAHKTFSPSVSAVHDFLFLENLPVQRKKTGVDPL